MEQVPSTLDDASTLAVVESKPSIPDNPFTLKSVYQKVMHGFRKSRRKQWGFICPPPIEEERHWSLNGDTCCIRDPRSWPRPSEANDIWAGVICSRSPMRHFTRVNGMCVHGELECAIDDGPKPLLLDKSSPPSSSTPPSSASAEYSSARIDRMMQTRSTFSTQLEFEIESSKDHWSETVPIADDSELVPQDPDAFQDQGIMVGEQITSRFYYLREVCDVRRESIIRDHYVVQQLNTIWPSRFIAAGAWQKKWTVGRKIGEGAQAEIYEAIPGPENESWGNESKHILKVFREGYYARDLQRLWPKQLATGYSSLYTCPIRYGMLLFNGRFAFLMPRYWGDLRKLLDGRMQKRLDCTHPPCSNWEATRSMLYIAMRMRDLHISNIVHRDLKASNVLVEMIERSESEMEEIGNNEVDIFYCRVADFESSKGVLGTGFWRAPEILIAVKNRCVTLDLFTKASDVYSSAMICYEIWTGCLPFENLKNNEYHIVLGGERPILPSGLKPWIWEMLERCWYADPCKRPTFQDICDTITNNSQDASLKCMDNIEEKEFEERMIWTNTMY